ncbi:ABC transporter ATP-binding protein [Exiguobacterium sp. UBA7533]|uniref:ABC transporter ATP-binding protein n=2 Tax=unclassified Exiguobacterium TaxID=2644629 RepID=UPI0025C718F4|nr:ABC transporter transmembrane domain-containing protein [Exiguobacterium sp. UBA7533]
MNHDINEKAVLKRLLDFVKPFKKQVSIAFILLFITTAAKLGGPYLVKIFIDEYVAPGTYPVKEVALLFTAYLLLHTTGIIVDYLQAFEFQKIALQVIQRLRIDVFRHVMHLRLAYFDRTPAGVLVSRITNDTEAIKELYIGVLSTFVQSGVQLIGTYIFLYLLEPRLATIALLLLPLFYFIIWIYRKYSTKYYAEVRDLLSKINAQLNESINGMAIIQQFRQEKRLMAEFEETNVAHQNGRYKNLKLDSWLLRPIIELLLAISIATLVTYFGVLSFSQTVQVGVVYAFISYMERIFQPVQQIMQQLSEFQQAVVSADRVFKVLDTDEPEPTKQLEGDARVSEGHIVFEDVRFSYDGEKNVLKGISFEAKKGQTIALVGHTGSGKSSIINILMRFYAYQSGRILIDGQPLEQLSEEELRKHVGLVLQDSFLFTGTVADNIRLFDSSISFDRVEAAAQFVQADGFINQLDQQYDSPVAERGATFSAGERQLISFARTMARDPKILILDEATSSIDTETEEKVQVALERMREGRTTIAIAHRLSTIQDADLILVLHQGEVIEQGNHQELIAQDGLYKKMYQLQSGHVTVS